MNFLERLCLTYGVTDHPYIASRFGSKAQSAFDICYMPPFEVSQDLLREAMDNKVYLRKLMNRVVIPIRDIAGETIGLVGRVVNDADITSDNPKYYNTVFSKTSVLFCNKDFWYTPLKEVWVVEGIPDVIQLYNYGCENVCGTLGTSIGETQVELLNSLGVPVHFMYDGDSPGQNAMVKIQTRDFKQPLLVRKLEMDYDPDECVNDGIPLPKPVPFATWWVQKVWEDTKREGGDKREFVRQVVLRGYASELKSVVE